MPTAQQLAGAMQLTAKSAVRLFVTVLPSPGVVTSDHALPFQCRAWSTEAPWGFWYLPTAQQLADEVQETA